MNERLVPGNEARAMHRRGAPGFTLIEVVIVVAIIAIIIGAATPAMMGYLRQKGVREAADQLNMDLQRAKLLAISRNANCSILFDEPNNRYTITLTNQIVSLDRYRGEVAFLPPIPNPPMITFNPQGLGVDAGSVFLINATGTRYELRTSMAGGISRH